MVLNLVICLLVVVVLALLGNICNEWLSKKTGVLLSESIESAGIPIVTLKNGNRSFNFLIDTGSDKSHISSEFVKLLVDTEKIEGEHLVITTANGSVEGEGDWLRVPLSHKGQSFIEDFMVLDLHDTFESLREEIGMQLHGILGITFLRKYRYILDFNELIAYTK